MRYWVLGFVLSPGKALPGEVDRCLTGSREMIHVSGEPLDYQKKKKKNFEYSFVLKRNENSIRSYALSLYITKCSVNET